MSSSPSFSGILLPQHANTQIQHVSAAKARSPFTDLNIPVTMRELCLSSSVPFAGQMGLIDFSTATRLPRHVHIAPLEGKTQHFTTERILVLNGVALVELNAQIYVVPPRTLVTIAPGVPHTWTACPAGVSLARALKVRLEGDRDGETGRETEFEPLPVSTGTFLMVYEYEDVTGFFPTIQTETLQRVSEYQRCEELEDIRFPLLAVEEIYTRAWFVWGRKVWRVGAGHKAEDRM